MPVKNHFQHQKLSADEPICPWSIRQADFPPAPDTPPFLDSIEKLIAALQPQIDAIWLTHGTFVGNDALGIFGQIERAVPVLGPTLKLLGKNLTDAITGDRGNFSDRFVDRLGGNISTNRFTWSGENTHLGRCKAAIELLAQLIQRIDRHPRVLLWGHSHAGNISALITNLIGADPWCREAFLDLVRPLFPPQNSQRSGETALDQVHGAFQNGSFEKLELDVINFGTPISYSWDTGGYRKLLHVVNHRPNPNHPDWLSPPIKVAGKWLFAGDQDDSASDPYATAGDMIQILGTSGSEFLPWLLDENTRQCETALQQFIAPGNGRDDYIANASIGARIAAEGSSILVNYHNDRGLATAMMGHSIYTRTSWLSFHCDLVREALYEG